MKRTRRSALMLRAKRATGNWAKADSQLSRSELDQRRAFAWLQGYDAARRDMREERLKASGRKPRPPRKCYHCGSTRQGTHPADCPNVGTGRTARNDTPVNKCKGCGASVRYADSYCGECLCEQDSE